MGGLFGFLSKGIAVIGLLVIPHVVEATNWQTWLFVALGCLVLFIPAILLFNGPWRRPSQPAPTPVAVGEAEA
ncbi:hypothetical protein [Nonomuraea salmonea]|uniref:hypothetical protein n=1 Tax=Nonomuraea salmonea TaxID=46181 RepID=UPI002FEDBD86